jgi:hypothetical protein
MRKLGRIVRTLISIPFNIAGKLIIIIGLTSMLTGSCIRNGILNTINKLDYLASCIRIEPGSLAA